MNRECLELDYYPCPILMDGHLYKSARTALVVRDMTSNMYEPEFREFREYTPDEAKEYKRDNPHEFSPYFIEDRIVDIFKINYAKFKPGALVVTDELLSVLLGTPDDYFNKFIDMDRDGTYSDECINAASLKCLKEYFLNTLKDDNPDIVDIIKECKDIDIDLRNEIQEEIG